MRMSAIERSVWSSLADRAFLALAFSVSGSPDRLIAPSSCSMQQQPADLAGSLQVSGVVGWGFRATANA
jgi:hypothetical protein